MSFQTAQEIAEHMSRLNQRLVLAESCTGGKTAAQVTEVPETSHWFCGSAVTYRENTKECWLGVSHELLEEFTAESQQASDSMVLGTLALTPEAGICCSITGHLGPGVDPDVDGLIFVSIAIRKPKSISKSDSADKADGEIEIVRRHQRRLEKMKRSDRQQEAASLMLELILEFLKELKPADLANCPGD